MEPIVRLHSRAPLADEAVAPPARRSLRSRHGSFALLLPLLASPAFAGWSMTQLVTQSGSGSPASEVTQRVWIEGDAAKLEMGSGGDHTVFEPGSYLLVRAGGAGVVLVNPARRTYARMDTAALTQSAQAMGGAGMEMTISGGTVVKLLEEPGGERLGRPTTHYRFQATYTRTMKMGMGMELEQEVKLIEDVWAAPSVTAAESGLAAGALVGSMGLPPELQQLERDAKASLAGLPLEQVSVMELRPTKGTGALGRMMQRRMNAERIETRTLVQSLVEERMPASVFEVPAGFTETELMQRGPAMPDLGGGR
jgi:hypothetical protein